MRKSLSLVYTGLLFSALLSPGKESARGATDIATDGKRVIQGMSLRPLAFTENAGQWDKEALYRANGRGVTMWFTAEGVLYHLTRRVDGDADWTLTDSREESSVSASAFGTTEHRVVRATLIGGNPSPEVVAGDRIAYTCNWFIGSDPDQWHTDVPSYSSLTYRNVYPGIDIRYRGNGAQIEHDFIISPSADPSEIALQYDGAQAITMSNSGDLVVVTDFGELVERIPKTYQERNGQLQPVSCCYEITDGNTVRFLLDEGYNQSLALVIDPVMVVYSTYLGGGGNELEIYGDISIAVDTGGNAYICGETQSSDFPTLTPIDAVLTGGQDISVTKLAAAGNTLVYSTYIGGSGAGTVGQDYSGYIVVDSFCSAYITGTTGSNDFPLQDPYDAVRNGGNDAYVTKLSPEGNALVFSTLLGSSGRDAGDGIAVDAVGFVYVTGITGLDAIDFPTVNAYDNTPNGGEDIFVTKFTPTGDALVYSTLLGGDSQEGDSDDGSPHIAVDAAGSAYITSETHSTNYPTVSAFDATHNTGSSEIFVSKLTPEGNALEYSTYLGGTDDYVFGIAVDALGCAYVTGLSGGDDFPTTPGAYDPTHSPGRPDAYVTKFAPEGDALVYSTFLAGGNYDAANHIAVDKFFNAYVTGITASSDFPTQDPLQEFAGGENNDAFLTKLSPAGNAVTFGTFLGGSGYDAGHGVAVDGSHGVYVVGLTTSSNLPVQNEYDNSVGAQDMFVVKLELCKCDCHGDPGGPCDGFTNILDVAQGVNAAFRNYPPMLDPNSDCPYQTSDVNCSGNPEVLDVVKLVNVAFRNGNPATEFCNPCP